MQITPEPITTTFAPEMCFEIEPRATNESQSGERVHGLPDALMTRGFNPHDGLEPRGVRFSALND